MPKLSPDERAQLNARIGTLLGAQDIVTILGRQFVRRHKEENMPPEAIAQVNALVNMINNDLKVSENNLRALMPDPE